MARVAVLVPDLLFGSKVLSMLEQAGHHVTNCPPGPEAADAAAGADVLVVDLTTDEIDGPRPAGRYPRRDEPAAHPGLLQPCRRRDPPARRGRGLRPDRPRSRMAREGAELVAGLVGAPS